MSSFNETTKSLLHALASLAYKLTKLERFSFEQAKLLHEREAVNKALRTEIAILREPDQKVLNAEHNADAACLAVADQHKGLEWAPRFDSLSAEQRAAFEDAATPVPNPALITLLSVFSAPCFSEAALEGMQVVRESLVGQHHANWEWLIVCEPETLEQLTAWASTEERIRLIGTGVDEASPWTALNVGLQQARGEWLTWIDDRVILRKHAFWVALEHLRTHPTARLLYADEDRPDSTGAAHSDPAFPCEATLYLLHASDYLGQCVLCRREDLIEAGGWDTSLRMAHRHGPWLRLTERWEDLAQVIAHVPLVLSHRRGWTEGAERRSEALLPCRTEAEGQIGVHPEHALIAQKMATSTQLASLRTESWPGYCIQAQNPTDGYKAALGAEVRHAEAKVLADVARLHARHLAEAHAFMEQQLAITSENLSQVDQRALTAERHLQALLSSTSWRITAPLRWVNMQAGLLKSQGVRGRLAALLRKIGLLRHSCEPGTVAAPTPQPEKPQRAEIPMPRYPGTHADLALADPALASLARPATLPSSFPVSGQNGTEVDHEPILHLGVLQDAPASLTFVVLVGHAELSDVKHTVHSILRQTDPAWELVFHVRESSAHLVNEWLDGDWRIRRFVHPQAADLSNLTRAFSLATAQFVGLVEAGDTVDDDLVKSFNRAASLTAEADVLYSDELWRTDVLDNPPVEVRKPGWSLEQQMSVDLLGRFCAIRKPIALACESWATMHACVALYGLNLEAAGRARAVVHVAELLYARRPAAGAGQPGGFFPPEVWDDLLQGVRGYLQRCGQAATVQIDETQGCLQVRSEAAADLSRQW